MKFILKIINVLFPSKELLNLTATIGLLLSVPILCASAPMLYAANSADPAKLPKEKKEPVGAIVMDGSSVEGIIVKKTAKNCSALKRIALKIFKDKGLKTFAVIDHAEGARSAGVKIPDSTVIIFGNPKIGSPVIAASPSSAIDFPMKLLLNEQNSECYISYNDPLFIKKRHHIPELPEIKKMSVALDQITTKLIE